MSRTTVKLSRVIVDILGKVIQLLKKKRVSYAVMGGIALQAWGRERATKDIDITISLEEVGSSDDFLRFLKNNGLEIIYTKQNRRIGSFQLIESRYTPVELGLPIEIDFFVTQTEYQREALKRAILVNVMGYRFKLISPEDLIIHKLLSNRAIDKVDVKNIIVEQKEGLDRQYLLFWAERLGISRQMRSLISKSG